MSSALDGVADAVAVSMSAAELRLMARLVADPPEAFAQLAFDLSRLGCRFPVAQAVLMWRNLPGMDVRMHADDRRERR